MPREWKPSFAGSWYPSDPAELQRLITLNLESSPENRDAPAEDASYSGPVVFVLPHAGLAYSARGQAAAWRTITAEQAKSFELVLVIAPTHYEYIPDRVSIGARFERYRAIPYPFPGADALFATAESPATVAREHAVELMLPFCSARLTALRGDDLPPVAAVVIGSLASPESAATIARRIAEDIRATADPSRTLVLVSSDFTHYGPRFGHAPFGANATPETLAAVREADLAVARAAADRSIDRYWESVSGGERTICGRYAIAVALALLAEIDPDRRATGRVLEYYTSLDAVATSTRDRDFVCYATIGIGAAGG